VGGTVHHLKPASPLFFTKEGIPVTKTRKSSSQKVEPALDTPTDLEQNAVDSIAVALNTVLADTFALYLKTKNFHWHVSGRHFRDYHLLFDEQSATILASTDEIAERVRKIGGTTLRSIGHIARLQTLADNDEDYVPAHEMLRELMNDNKAVVESLRKAHKVADDNDDVGTASLLENFIDEAEKRTWFLFEASRETGDNEG
jgi:starvation-inducible DNA-binding protein